MNHAVAKKKLIAHAILSERQVGIADRGEQTMQRGGASPSLRERMPCRSIANSAKMETALEGDETVDLPKQIRMAGGQFGKQRTLDKLRSAKCDAG